jgi:hypothetical protein
MKYLKYFNTLNESLDDVRQLLSDIFTDLIDEGYDVEIFHGYDDSGKAEWRVTIRNKDLSRLMIFDLLISNALKKSISIMSEIGYRYSANFHRSDGDISPFYIYLDSRGLRTSGLKMDENWPYTSRINIDFFQ